MMFPFALISGYITEDFGQRLEVRILELEEDRAVFRTADRIGTVSRLEVYFYDDRAGQYDGIVLEHPAVTESGGRIRRGSSISSMKYRSRRKATKKRCKSSMWHTTIISKRNLRAMMRRFPRIIPDTRRSWMM